MLQVINLVLLILVLALAAVSAYLTVMVTLQGVYLFTLLGSISLLSVLYSSASIIGGIINE